MTCLVRISIFWTITVSFRIRLNPIDSSKLNLRCNAWVEMQFFYASTFVLKAENLFNFRLVTPSKRDSLQHLECHDISSVINFFYLWQITIPELVCTASCKISTILLSFPMQTDFLRYVKYTILEQFRNACHHNSYSFVKYQTIQITISLTLLINTVKDQ